MKLWKSACLALGVFLSVIAVSLFSLIKLNIVHTDVASAPVYAASTGSESSKQDFTVSKSSVARSGVELSLEPRIPLAYASWTTVSASDTDVKTTAAMLAEEWLKYDGSFITKTGLKKIYLVRNLSVNGQMRSGMPESNLEDALYFDVSSTYTSSEAGQYMRRTFHHEYRHLIDYNLYGTYTPSTSSWSKCNVAGFTYGKGGASMYSDPEYAHKSHPSSGFVDGYATAGIDEDRAEVYALFMTNPEKLQALTLGDTALSCKVALVQSTQSLLL